MLENNTTNQTVPCDNQDILDKFNILKDNMVRIAKDLKMAKSNKDPNPTPQELAAMTLDKIGLLD